MRTSLIVFALCSLTSVAHADDPVKVFEGQVANLSTAKYSEVNKTLVKTRPLVLPPNHIEDGELLMFLESDVFRTLAPSVKTKVVGKNGAVTWIVADLEQPYDEAAKCAETAKKCKKKRALRMSELFVDAQTFALHIDEPAPNPDNTYQGNKVPGGSQWPAPSPLVDGLAKPALLAGAFLDDPNIVVLGPDKKQRAVGPAAVKKLLATLVPANATWELRDVSTATPGVIQANIAVDPPKSERTHTLRVTLFFVTLPDKSQKAVALHYSMTYDSLGW